MTKYQIFQGEDTGDSGRILPVLATTIVVDGQPYTVWMPIHDPALGGSGWKVAAPGTQIGTPAVKISPQYDTVSAAEHAGGCDVRSRGRGTCACGADDAWPDGLRGPLKAAAVALLGENFRLTKEEGAAREAANLAELERDTAWAREPGRIVVGGSDDGWRLWESTRRGGYRNTGEVVCLLESLEPYEPHLVEVYEDVIGLYSIRDPRLPVPVES